MYTGQGFRRIVVKDIFYVLPVKWEKGEEKNKKLSNGLSYHVSCSRKRKLSLFSIFLWRTFWLQKLPCATILVVCSVKRERDKFNLDNKILSCSSFCPLTFFFLENDETENHTHFRISLILLNCTRNTIFTFIEVTTLLQTRNFISSWTICGS